MQNNCVILVCGLGWIDQSVWDFDELEVSRDARVEQGGWNQNVPKFMKKTFSARSDIAAERKFWPSALFYRRNHGSISRLFSSRLISKICFQNQENSKKAHGNLCCWFEIWSFSAKCLHTVLPRLSEVFWDNITEIHIIENYLNRINENDTKRKYEKITMYWINVLVPANVIIFTGF